MEKRNKVFLDLDKQNYFIRLCNLWTIRQIMTVEMGDEYADPGDPSSDDYDKYKQRLKPLD